MRDKITLSDCEPLLILPAYVDPRLPGTVAPWDKDADKLLMVIAMNPGLTAMEIAQKLIDKHGYNFWKAYQVASKRMSDLHKAGKIRVEAETICSVTMNRSRTWIKA